MISQMSHVHSRKPFGYTIHNLLYLRQSQLHHPAGHESKLGGRLSLLIATSDILPYLLGGSQDLAKLRRQAPALLPHLLQYTKPLCVASLCVEWIDRLPICKESLGIEVGRTALGMSLHDVCNQSWIKVSVLWKEL